jgi:hypothetical protein
MRCTRLFSLTLATTAAVLGSVSSAHAQAQGEGTRFGVAVSYADHFDLGVGAFVKFHLADLNAHPLTGRVGVDYYFPGSSGDGVCYNDLGEPYSCDGGGYTTHYLRIDIDGLYDIANPSSNLKPYVGAGLGYSHFSFGYDCPGCGNGGIGLNILGGINFMANSKLMPFAEIKLGLAGGVGSYGGDTFILKGGIHF